MKADQLGDEDKKSLRLLTAYVESFVLEEVVDKDGKNVFASDGQHVMSCRYIDTKALLDCKNEEDAMKLLGIFSLP